MAKKTSTDTDLINIPNGGTPAVADDEWDAMVAGKGVFSRVQLMTNKSDLVTTGEFPMNHFALVGVGNSVEDDLGKTLEVIVCGLRAKAMRIGDPMIIVFEVKHLEFAKIQAESTLQDSGCMFGPEFLVYIPSVEKFATLFFNSKSMRREAPNMRKRLGKGALLQSKLIETARFKWTTTIVKPCTAPLTPPDPEPLEEALETFNNPEPIVHEKAPETSGRER